MVNAGRSLWAYAKNLGKAEAELGQEHPKYDLYLGANNEDPLLSPGWERDVVMEVSARAHLHFGTELTRVPVCLARRLQFSHKVNAMCSEEGYGVRLPSYTV